MSHNLLAAGASCLPVGERAVSAKCRDAKHSDPGCLYFCTPCCGPGSALSTLHSYRLLFQRTLLARTPIRHPFSRSREWNPRRSTCPRSQNREVVGWNSGPGRGTPAVDNFIHFPRRMEMTMRKEKRSSKPPFGSLGRCSGLLLRRHPRAESRVGCVGGHAAAGERGEAASPAELTSPRSLRTQNASQQPKVLLT